MLIYNLNANVFTIWKDTTVNLKWKSLDFVNAFIILKHKLWIVKGRGKKLMEITYGKKLMVANSFEIG